MMGASMANEKYGTSIEELAVSRPVRDRLERVRLTTIGQVMEKSEDQLLALFDFDRALLDEVRLKLIEKGFLQIG